VFSRQYGVDLLNKLHVNLSLCPLVVINLVPVIASHSAYSPRRLPLSLP
jgi:hypothetical protein